MSSVQNVEQGRREELARFLRDRRAKVQPGDAGINVRRKRRALGLLREEVAAIAGVSLTWYTWLEQARSMNPSARTLEGLATALRLDAVERTHLYRLARPDLDPHAAAGAPEQLAPALLALLEGLAPHPAYVINARWDILAWNRPAELLFHGFEHLHGIERNVLHRLLFDADWQDIFVDCDAIVAGAVAQFRATTVNLTSDADVGELVASLSASSERFKQLWEQQDVAQPEARRKVLRHPDDGVLTFDYATLHPDGAPRGVRFTIYTPADAATRERVRELVGTRVTA